MEKRYTEGFVNKKSGNISELSDSEFGELLDVVLYEKGRRDMREIRQGHNVEIEYELLFKGSAPVHMWSEMRPTLVKLKRKKIQEFFPINDDGPPF